MVRCMQGPCFVGAVLWVGASTLCSCALVQTFARKSQSLFSKKRSSFCCGILCISVESHCRCLQSLAFCEGEVLRCCVFGQGGLSFGCRVISCFRRGFQCLRRGAFGEEAFQENLNVLLPILGFFVSRRRFLLAEGFWYDGRHLVDRALSASQHNIFLLFLPCIFYPCTFVLLDLFRL